MTDVGTSGHRAADPEVSVVMVSYFTGDHLWTAIDAVLSQPVDIELILVDNGNPPDVARALADRASAEPRLTVITGHGNIGYARACNRGAARARGRFLFILNPDTDLAGDTLPVLLAEASKFDAPVLLGPMIRNPDGTEQRGARRATLTPLRAVAEGIGLHRLMPHRSAALAFNRTHTPPPTDTAPVDVISGAAMFLLLADFRRIGGMDEGYFLHVEDIDFCHRFAAAGGRILFVPDAAVTHIQGSSRASPAVVEWHKTRGFLRYFWTHFGSVTMVVPLTGMTAL